MKSHVITVAGALMVAGFAGMVGAQAPQPAPDSQAQPRAESAEGRHGNRGRRAAKVGGRGMRALLRGIELTEAQRTQLREIHERHRTEVRALRERARVNAPEGQRARPDSATMVAARQLMERQRSEVRAALTPEQQRQFDANVAEVRNRMEQRRGNLPDRGHRGRTR